HQLRDDGRQPFRDVTPGLSHGSLLGFESVVPLLLLDEKVANRPIMRYEFAMGRDAVRVHVLALADCTALVPVGVLDLLRKSIDLPAPRPGRRRRVTPKLVAAGDRAEVRSAGGLILRCDATLRTAGAADVIVVPALDPDLDRHLALNRAVLPWLRRAFH